MHRIYENQEITVFWNSEKCRHAKMCVGGSPDTFDFQRRPWVRLDLASNPEIWQAISKCPTGALSCVYNYEVTVVFEANKQRSAAYYKDDLIGICEYEEIDGAWNIYHTEVSEEYTGKSIAKRLVYKVIEAGEKACVDVVGSCSYADKVLRE